MVVKFGDGNDGVNNDIGGEAENLTHNQDTGVHTTKSKPTPPEDGLNASGEPSSPPREFIAILEVPEATRSDTVLLEPTLVLTEPVIVSDAHSPIPHPEPMLTSILIQTEEQPGHDDCVENLTSSITSDATITTLDSMGLKDSSTTETDESGTGGEASTLRPKRSVRFNSRVRITSGIHRHRHSSSHKQDSLLEDEPNTTLPTKLIIPSKLSRSNSISSSYSGSPSSSISAPLRSASDDSSSASRWGPLGSRVSWMAGRYGFGRQQSYQARHGNYGTNERTPLVGAFMRAAYNGEPPRAHRNDDYNEAEYERQHSPNMSTHPKKPINVDETFGHWARRIFNRHWWWWHLEPIVRCTCLDEEEDDDRYIS